mmetsp:Transcript_32007/g.66819  ORF Transcript_32007/g.66819 Transcript_32007/m.66819 type:complete len:82 (-) Transcript_32007:248-493(-)
MHHCLADNITSQHCLGEMRPDETQNVTTLELNDPDALKGRHGLTYNGDSFVPQNLVTRIHGRMFKVLQNGKKIARNNILLL